ncbi:MAG TPA: thiamine-phosphate kinase [Luteibacter sp.]|jgi:thiamine-monophosphate kinase|uniref:thiamine-phosphate kinase n=1 Tax=Luteibacter sp. TaxID=1886636 RepID=UPI002F3F0960
MEFDLIERIRRHTDVHRDDVVTGIGDDAAVVAVPAGRELAIAVDTLVEGIHFPAGTAAADIGWKALAVNLSDLAAMGATPAWALLALTLPAPDEAFIDGLARGFAELATPFRLALIGGDTTRGPLTVTVTVHGFTSPGQALLRSGARVGDVVMVTGTLGDAAAGLRCLSETDASPYAGLIDRLNRPTPRVAAGQALRGIATACIDVSDGLVADLGHICKQSRVGAEIDAALLPRSSAMLTHFHDTDAIDFALAGGDDYELCFTVPAEKASEIAADLARLGCGATRIGRVVEGEGVRVIDATGATRTPTHAGWNHFA